MADSAVIPTATALTRPHAGRACYARSRAADKRAAA